MIKKFFPLLDKCFSKTDREHIIRTKNIRLIPDFQNRRGGKLSYAEWAYVIGIFQTIIYQSLQKTSANNILDIGCGTGLLGISSEPFVSDDGQYTGIDIMKEDIEYCTGHYPSDIFKFIHLDVANATYANIQSEILKKWPIKDNSQDLVTALSVWTHMNENDAIFYFKEIYRVLRPGAKAIITFFLLDQAYITSLGKRSNETGRFHFTNQNDWIFDVTAYNSENWMTVKSARYPEDAIGVTQKGLEILLSTSGLKLVQLYPGNWKETPGIFFQDIIILEK
ncbi:class I SAM-dependent methyltransferase [Dyadobacter sp. CY356]|uniref:class I SAM-dependent methyltransferase n=1 Tax=Dyadobacter sp. CY356 TaxID=2906442 RepID=UPI001F45F6C4|nr:class I SAM-dependent methyltransferase [Dyadobacter sp. CY356]MCF0055095.1 class I SAM-dependent methyltransferase [Dyadobacter sp. CY356]